MKSAPPWCRFVAVPAMLLAVLSVDQAFAQTPVVKIEATQPATSEPRPEARIIPGEFTITRSFAGAQALVVYVQYGGSAMSGSDYEALPREVTIPAGALTASTR